jgi:hypothetical protein
MTLKSSFYLKGRKLIVKRVTFQKNILTYEAKWKMKNALGRQVLLGFSSRSYDGIGM